MNIFLALSPSAADWLFPLRNDRHVQESGKNGRRQVGAAAQAHDFHPIKGLLLGAGITIAIQSSSAMTVMLVGLVNSGVMELGQTIGIIMGSNIGTTLTAWLLSLTGIESENFFVNFLKPRISPPAGLAGILLIMGSKRQRRRDVGRVMMGFSILMYGMELMSGAVSPLADMPGFTHFMTAFTNPFLGVLVGAAFTGIIQSSAASVGILQALAMTGSVTYGIAIPIIMGQNIGTLRYGSDLLYRRQPQCQAGVRHPHLLQPHRHRRWPRSVLCGGNAHLSVFPSCRIPSTPWGSHSATRSFNVCTTILLLPFTRQLEWLARRRSPTEDKPSDFAFLDPRLMRTPGVAASECASMVNQMGALGQTSMNLVLEPSSSSAQRPGRRRSSAMRTTWISTRTGVGGYLVRDLPARHLLRR